MGKKIEINLEDFRKSSIPLTQRIIILLMSKGGCLTFKEIAYYLKIENKPLLKNILSYMARKRGLLKRHWKYNIYTKKKERVYCLNTEKALE